MKKTLVAAVAVAFCCLQTAQAQTEFPSKLAGHALIPAQTFLPAPDDAPADLQISGKFTTGARVELLGSVEGKSANRPTGVSVPFRGQRKEN